MSVDEAVMLSVKDGLVPPTLRLYRWKPSAVSIGTFQSMEDEVDIEYCRKNGIDMIRRLTGGGAVYHDYDGEVTYSVIVPKGHRVAPFDIEESYEILCGGVVSALDEFALEAEFCPINDVVVDGKKISGNAQTRRHSCVLQHGTVLLDLNVETMFSILKVDPEKISDKLVTDVKQRVISLRQLLDEDVSPMDLSAALVVGFSRALNVNLQTDQLTELELRRASELAESKYGTHPWNFLR
ncbi:lipoate--protein ligase family protein [Candidatus Thorarchaeota archaeon]|nr:MAG: lipoate--protein ligase family protein [Candidatus Thorarchaeota archaeon]